MLSSTKKLACACSAFLFVAAGNTAGAAPQPDRALKQRLDSMSRQMAQKGYLNFIVLQAVNDSLLELGNTYSFAWVHDSVKVNDVPVPQPYQSRYATELKAFFVLQKNLTPAGLSFSVKGDTLREDELLDARSSFWTDFKTVSVQNLFYVRKDIVPLMAADGTLDTAKPYKIVYDMKGLKVNDAVLPLDRELKYKALFKTAGNFEPVAQGDDVYYYGGPKGTHYEMPSSAKVDDAFTQTLIDAGLADAKQPIRIGVRHDAIIVNGKKLKSGLNKKMLVRYKELNPTGPDTADIIIYREGVPVPDIRTGNSVIHIGK